MAMADRPTTATESQYSGETMLDNFRRLFDDINRSNVSGAMDVLVVVGPDGKWGSTPFHVRFGKFRVFLSRGKKVCIEVNGQHTAIHMKLNSDGKAYFPRKRTKPARNGKKHRKLRSKSSTHKSRYFLSFVKKALPNQFGRLYDIIQFINSAGRRARKQVDQRRKAVRSTRDFVLTSNFAMNSPAGIFSTVDWGHITYAGMRRTTLSRADVLASGPSCVERQRPVFPLLQRSKVDETERSLTAMDAKYFNRARQLFKLHRKNDAEEKDEAFQHKSSFSTPATLDKADTMLRPYKLLANDNVSHKKFPKERSFNSIAKSISELTSSIALASPSEYESVSECRQVHISEGKDHQTATLKLFEEELAQRSGIGSPARTVDSVGSKRARGKRGESKRRNKTAALPRNLREKKRMKGKRPVGQTEYVNRKYRTRLQLERGKGSTIAGKGLTDLLDQRGTDHALSLGYGKSGWPFRRLKRLHLLSSNEKGRSMLQITRLTKYMGGIHSVEETDRALGELLRKRVDPRSPTSHPLKARNGRRNLLRFYYKENVVRKKHAGLDKDDAERGVSKRWYLLPERNEPGEETTRLLSRFPMVTSVREKSSCLFDDPLANAIYSLLWASAQSNKNISKVVNVKAGERQACRNIRKGSGRADCGDIPKLIRKTSKSPRTSPSYIRLPPNIPSAREESDDSSSRANKRYELKNLPRWSIPFVDLPEKASKSNINMESPASLSFIDAVNQQRSAVRCSKQKPLEVSTPTYDDLVSSLCTQNYVTLFFWYSKFVHQRESINQQMFTSDQMAFQEEEPTTCYLDVSEDEASAVPELVLTEVRESTVPSKKFKRVIHGRRLSSLRPRKISYVQFFTSAEDSMLHIAVRFIDAVSEIQKAYVKHKVVVAKYNSRTTNALNNYTKDIEEAGTRQTKPIVKFTKIWYNRCPSMGDDSTVNYGDRMPRSTASAEHKELLRLKSKNLKRLGLKPGPNSAKFFVSTKFQGVAVCECEIYLWNWNDKIVVSDIDGTITKSDILGHFLPLFGNQWIHKGVAKLLSKIHDQGYQLLFLSSRPMGQSQMTKTYLTSINEGNAYMPDGPLLLAPLTLLAALHQEVVLKTPHVFKAKCLQQIRSLFPNDVMPFYGAFGNQITDIYAYAAVGIPPERIFCINPHSFLVSAARYVHYDYEGLIDRINWLFPNLNRPQNQVARKRIRKKRKFPLKPLPKEVFIFKGARDWSIQQRVRRAFV